MTYSIGPVGMPEPQVISTISDEWANLSGSVGGSGGSAVYPTANLAYFFPFKITTSRTYNKVWWLNGAAVAGNVDVGIYTISGATGTRVVASTAEAAAGISGIQVAAAFTATTLTPGTYYFAISASSTTQQFWRFGQNTNIYGTGNYQAATSHPLSGAASPTVVRCATGYIPVFGLSELTTI